MLETPKEVLGEGYPLPTDKARKETAPIWKLAFQIHETAHIGDNRFYEGTILPVKSDEHPDGTPYCDCYMQAWLQLHDPVYIAKVEAEEREAANDRKRIRRALRNKLKRAKARELAEQEALAFAIEFDERQV